MQSHARRSVPALHELRARRDELVRIAASHGASNIRVFGSVARGELDVGDVDLLVALESGRSLLDLGALSMDLAEALDCEVDVVTDKGLRRRLRDPVIATAVPL